MVWEFPAVSHTRIEVWKKPQFTRKGMWWFTLFFGMFGLHHLLLRSPQTTILFFIANCLSFGYCYFYDLIQLSESTYSGVGTEGLNKYGLNHPWGPLGLAKGMWIPESGEPMQASDSGPTPTAPPAAPTPMVGGGTSDPANPWFFFVYSLLLPLAPLALAIAGDTKNALSRFLFLTIIPFGFLLYAGSLVYDYWMLLSQPSDVALFGTKRFFPFTVLGMDKDGHSPSLTGKQELIGCPPANNLQMLIRMMLPLLRFFFPELANGLETAISTAETVKTQVVDRGIAAGQQAIQTGQQFKATAETLTTKIPEALTKAQQIASNPESLIPQAKMVGGGKGQEDSPLLQGLTIGSIVAVVGGGLLLQASRSFSSWSNDRTDSPPFP